MGEEDLMGLLRSVCQENPQVVTAYIASPEGAFYLSEDIELPEDYDPRKRLGMTKRLKKKDSMLPNLMKT